MAIALRQIDAATAYEARRLYEQTDVPVGDIARMIGLSERAFYRRMETWGWERRIERLEASRPPPPAAPPPDPVAVIEAQAAQAVAKEAKAGPKPAKSSPRRAQPATDDLYGLVETGVRRYLETFNRMVEKFGAGPESAAAAERAARALAVLGRTARDMNKARRDEKGARATQRENADAGAADLARLRTQLAGRLRKLADGSHG